LSVQSSVTWPSAGVAVRPLGGEGAVVSTGVADASPEDALSFPDVSLAVTR